MQTTVQTEFGPTAQVADWSQLQAYTGQIAAFCDSIGLANGQGAWVLRNGNSFYSSERHYFVERHNGTVPSGWLVHDTIDNNTLDLGSWWNSRRILAYVPDSASGRFVLTAGTYSWDANMQTTVQSEFGPTAQVADWSQLQAYTGQIAAFCNNIGLANGQGAWVLRNGNSFYSSERHYFVERHNGTVPSGWLVHDTIDNNTLDLGSWWNSRRILAYVPDVSGWLYMQWPYAWSVEANSWLYFLVSGGDLWAYNFATGQWTRMQ